MFCEKEHADPLSARAVNTLAVNTLAVNTLAVNTLAVNQIILTYQDGMNVPIAIVG